jgi:predicted DNA-binding transcriptional regulator AlpA
VPDTPDRSLSTREAAAYLGISAQALFRLRRLGRGPVYYQPSPRKTRYFTKDLEAWRARYPKFSKTHRPHGA